ncbi:FMN-binding protein [Lachnospiraceae bacterium MD1]|jgi:uncharacterized protein with FMN-binding domain|uniref:FMN-binding protein n=1 Tax=Variimorphobacter saccharofermentans TaxID=2755051 RepID=A0A839JZY6_9FIRM|nr:FMN-binding protein [Variimorphobacter saccharofermentans]MBB2183243.1 FMN-binding protein [Variimorphobacter saccharofermentans]
MNRTLKILIKVFVVMICLIILGLGIFIGYLHIGKKAALETPVYGIDLSDIDDGTYIGSYEGYRWSNTVSVTVENHTITKIEILKPQTYTSQETVDTLILRVISEQNTDVDVVTGATADSRTFLRAVENALYPERQDNLK